jgi:hypothetical protein
MTVKLTAAATAAALSLAGAGIAAAAAPTSHSGQIKMFAAFTNDPSTPVVIAGAIGDHGRGVFMTRSGHPNPNGSFLKITLTQGTIEIDGSQVTRAFHPEGAINKDTCSVLVGGSAPVQIVEGTGAYAGIHGSLHATGQAAVVAPHAKNGSCSHTGQGAVIYGSVVISGNVTY